MNAVQQVKANGGKSALPAEHLQEALKKKKKPPVRKQLNRTPSGKIIIPPQLKRYKDIEGRVCYYDFSTINTSFLQVCKDLKTAGVKYNYFMLALYDPELYGVDPYDPNLTQNQIRRINIECIRNPWYFLREVSRIPVQGGAPVMFRLNRATCAVIWLFLMGIDTYITIARQIGKTISIIGILTWTYLYGTSNSQFLFMHIDKPRAAKNLKDLKNQIDCLPEWMQQKTKIDFANEKILKGKNNVNSISNIINGNEIITQGQASSAEDADNLARGLSQPIQMFDEFEFIKYNDIILAVAGPAYVTASTNARKNHAAYGRFFSSTAGDLDSNAGQAAQKLLKETYRWHENLYDEYWKKGGQARVKEIIKTNSKSQVVYIEYPYYLLGKDDEYYFEQYRMINDNAKFKREILLKRMHGSSLSPYDIEDLNAIESNKKDPIQIEMILGLYELKIYEKIRPDRPYFLGIDISDGYGVDNSTFVIWDPYHMRTVATLGSMWIPPDDLDKIAIILCKKYVRIGPVIIERNRGAALISKLMRTPLRNRLYMENEADDDSTKIVMDKFGVMKKEANIRKNVGVATTSTSRPKMFTSLQMYITDYKDSFVSPDIIGEIMTLIRFKNGKIAAAPGMHDDYIMAFLMCVYVFEYGSRLAQYGFVKGRLYDEDKNKGLNHDPTYREQMEIQSELPEDMQGYFKPQKTARDDAYELYMQIEKERNSGPFARIPIFGQNNVQEPTDNYSDDYYNGYSISSGNFFDELNNVDDYGDY